MELKKLEEALENSWDRKTCHPKTSSLWTPKNPAFGQCKPTALIVQDYFMGEIFYCRRPYHYWNMLLSGKEVDLTRKQFPKGMTMHFAGIKSRHEMLDVESALKALSLERYMLLKERVEDYLSKHS